MEMDMLPETRNFVQFVFLLNNFYLKTGSTIDVKFSMILYGTYKGKPPLIENIGRRLF